MALNCFLNSAEPIKIYKVLVGAFVGNVGKNVGKIYHQFMRFGIHSEQYQNNYSKEEEQKFTQIFGELTSEFAAKMTEGVHASDESVQELVKKHYDFILQFWTPNKEAYKSLAMTYILPSPYRDSYEEVAQGLGKYHYDAVCIWADKNL